ncbi:hypothetical protein V3C99_010461 [Haemonchus contortus]|nr:unnamed protein product [Haemonchus contortus]
MSSSPPPAYPGNEKSSDITLKDNTIVADKVPVVDFTNPTPVTSIPSVNSNIEMNTLPSTGAILGGTLPYATAPNTPTPKRDQVNMPSSAQSAPALNNIGGGQPTGGTQCMTSPQAMPMTYTAPMVMPGMATYSGPMPVHPMFAQSAAMGLAPPVQPQAMGTNPNQNGGINLVVNTNANSNSNANGARGTDGQACPAPRPCPKCRLGYITRGQARIREMCIKALAYGTICCTCLLPLQLLKTNYVDKCSYCGEEYGFRGELFEKVKPPKMQ